MSKSLNNHKDDPDVKLLTNLYLARLNLLKSIVQEANITFDITGNDILEDYKLSSSQEFVFDDINPYNNIIMKNCLGATEDNKSLVEDLTIAEGIAKYMSIGDGDAAAAFGELYELAESQCERYLSSDKLARASEAVKYLMKFGLSKLAACASVAVFLSENGCTPNKVCNKEAEGNGSEYTKNGGYGAGIASWTGVEHKARCLALLGLPASTKIETLSMEQQCKMYALELFSKRGNQTCNKILTGNLEEASVAAMFKTHGDYRPNTLGKYGYTYRAAYAEQIEHTPKLMRFAGVSTPSVYHKTALLTRVLLTPKLLKIL